MTKKYSALDRQKSIYINGLAGKKSKIPTDLCRLKEKAKKAMNPQAFGYIEGGAGNESTMRSNRSDFDRWKIIPRMLKDVSSRDTSIELFGHHLPSPFLLSPVGVLEMVHPKADLAVGKAAASMGVPMIFSNQASVPMEKVSAAMANQPRWFQLYWSKSNALVKSLVQRAEKCGCTAIVVTLDTTLLGWRTRDLDLAYLPFLQGKGIAQYTSDPVFLDMLNQPTVEEGISTKPPITFTTISSIFSLAKTYPGGFINNLTSGIPLKAVRQFINIYSRPSLQWEDLAFLRSCTKLPIILKGILHPSDAQKALDYGVDGIMVSNHGGRQVDGSISTIAALPSIMDVVKDQVPVLLDSGIRGGADIFKAIALGAKAVGIGRLFVYGLTIDGEEGVKQVIRNLMADFELTMGLSGCKTISEINRDCIIKG